MDLEFQKRKLNKCCVSGCTDKVLRTEISNSGTVFFVCRGHASLLATLDRELKKVEAPLPR
jgi:hypothetical protein